MLVHIVCWKYKPEADDAARVEHIDRLRALIGVIDSIRSFEIGLDILHLDRSFDTGLVATFDDEAGLDEYTVHPEHQKVAAMGRDIAQQVVSVDFLTNDRP
jgi:hypothetical protein